MTEIELIESLEATNIDKDIWDAAEREEKEYEQKYIQGLNILLYLSGDPILDYEEINKMFHIDNSKECLEIVLEQLQIQLDILGKSE